MSFQVLISTMYQKDYSLLSKMNLSSDAVVINQCFQEDKRIISFNGHEVLWIDTCERGLSKSRNMALINATATYCLLADDDEVFNNNLEEKVMEAFYANPNIDVIRFQVRGIEREFKKYASKKAKIGYFRSLKTSSVEIAFKLEQIKLSNIRFDEMIGAGTEYMMGEENAFLFACIRKKLNILYVPTCIADLHLNASTWFKGYTEEYFIGKGAALTSMTPNYSWMLIILYIIKKIKTFLKYGFFKSTKSMFKGRKEYLQIIQK